MWLCTTVRVGGSLQQSQQQQGMQQQQQGRQLQHILEHNNEKFEKMLRLYGIFAIMVLIKTGKVMVHTSLVFLRLLRSRIFIIMSQFYLDGIYTKIAENESNVL